MILLKKSSKEHDGYKDQGDNITKIFSIEKFVCLIDVLLNTCLLLDKFLYLFQKYRLQQMNEQHVEVCSRNSYSCAIT